MWFSKTKHQETQNTADILASVLSDGITLSINELINYQSKASLINLAGNKNLSGKMAGNYLARSKGRGMEFDEVRHYQVGDDIRAIDWRVTARTGETHTKLFREEIERPVLIATDLSNSMLFGSQLLFKSVQAAHIAALVAWHAKSRGDRIGGVVFNQSQHSELKPRSRQQGVLHYLHALAEIHQDSFSHQKENDIAANTLSLEQNCARLRQLAKPGSLVYLITDGHYLNQEVTRQLAHISRHCELVVCLVTDPLEHKLPDSQKRINVAITDGENRQNLQLGDKKIASDYQRLANLLNSEKEQLLTKAGARILNFSASETLEAQLKNGVATWNR
ncbi:DUF58 domain-containing protein [Colwelliaceae bacterium 6471]